MMMIAIFIILLQLIHFVQSQSILDLYVSHEPIGSQHYKTINEAFESFMDSYDEKGPIVNIYLASSEEPYVLKGGEYEINSIKASSLKISTWLDSSSSKQIESAATLVLDGVKITAIEVDSFSLSNLKVSAERGVIELSKPKTLTFENIEMIGEFGTYESFIMVYQGWNLTVSQLNLNLTEYCSFIQFKNANLSITPQIILKDININYGARSFNDDENPAIYPPLFRFVLVKGPEGGDISIERLNFKFPESDFYFHPGQIFHLLGFSSAIIDRIDFIGFSGKLAAHHSWMKFESFQNLEIKSINLANNQLAVRGASPLFNFASGKNVLLKNLNFSGNSLTKDDDLAFQFFGFNDMSGLNFLNHFIAENNIPCEFSLLKAGEGAKSNRTVAYARIQIKDVLITNNSNNGKGFFSYVSVHGEGLEQVLISNIEYKSNNNLIGRIFSIANQPSKRNPRILYANSVPINLTNISIIENERAEDLAFLYFMPLEDVSGNYDCNQLFELYSISINDTRIENNQFSKGDCRLWLYEVALFQSKQAEVQLKNFTVKNNSFEVYSFYSLSQRPASFFLLSSHFSNNSFVGSQLVDSNYFEGYYCNFYKDKVLSFNEPLYKYVVIEDSNFADMEFLSSKLFNFNTGYLFFRKNDFSNLQFSGESMFLANLFYQTTKASYPISFKRNTTLEALILKNKPDFSNVLYDIINRIFEEQKNVAYLTSLSGNNFNNIGSEFDQFIALSSQKFTQGCIHVERNTFFSIKLKSSATSSLLLIDNFMNAKILDNSFVFLNGHFAILSLPQGLKSQNLEASLNEISYVNIKGFLLYTGESIETFSLTKNTFSTSTFKLACVSIDVNEASGLWTLDGNRFEKVDFVFDSTNKQGESHGFISLYSTHISKSSEIIFSHTEFESMRFGSIGKSVAHVQMSLFSVKSLHVVKISNITVGYLDMSNPGPLMDISSPTLFSLRDSLFRNINTNSSAGMIVLASALNIVENVTFLFIDSESGSGIFSLTPALSDYKIQMSHCHFQSLGFKKPGNVLAIQTLEQQVKSPLYSIQLEIQSCDITRFVSGNAIFLSGGINCVDCKVFDTYIDGKIYFGSTNEGILTLSNEVSGSVDLSNITIVRPQLIRGPLINIVNCPAATVVLNKIFYNGENKEFYLGWLDSGTLEINNSNFTNISIDKNPLINIIPTPIKDGDAERQLQANIKMENSRFRNLSYGGTSYLGFSFYSNPLEYEYSMGVKPFGTAFLLAVIPTNIFVEKCVFETFDNVPVFLMGASSDRLRKGVSSSVTMKDSEFRKNRFFMGPCLIVLPKSYSPKVTISNSLFEENKAYVGAAMVVYNASLKISDTRFLSNNGLMIGRAIFLGGTSLKNSSLSENVTFYKNQGEYEGDIRSEAVDFRMRFISEESTSIEQHFNESGLWLTKVTTQELQKGKLMLEYIDAYGNVAPDLSSATQGIYELKKRSDQDGDDDEELLNTFSAFFEYDSRTIRFLSLSNVMASGQGDQQLLLNLKYTSDRINLDKLIYIQIRPCRAGEFNNTDLGICQACLAPTYSLYPNESCTKCPTNARCPNQSMIIPFEGYWSSREAPTDVHKCRQDHITRCLNNKTDTQNCADGYAGPLCEACDFNNNYVEKSYLECGQCQDSKKSLRYSIIGTILYFLYQAFSILAIYKANSQKKNVANDYLWKRQVERSYYLKSFMTYTQLMSLLYMDSTYLVKDFGLTSQIGNPSSLITYGTQCSMKALGIENYDLIFYQVYLILSTPFIQLVIFGVLLLLLKCFSESLKIDKVLKVAALYFIISYQPGIVTNLSQFLSCKTVGEETFIASHAFWSCNDPRYQTVAGIIARPNLILWCLVIPVLVLGTLVVKKRNCEEEEEINSSFGMITNDVKLEFYYWGIIMVVLKLVISFLVYGMDRGSETHIFVCLILLWGYQRLVGSKKPYKAKSFNNFEVTMINLLMLNIIMVRYLMTSDEIEIKVGSLVVSAIMNGGFVLMLVWKILSLSLIDVLSKFEHYVLKRRTTRASELNENFDLQL